MKKEPFWDLVTELIKAGYTAGESVWYESVSYVNYEYTKGVDLMYIRSDAPPSVKRLFCLHSIESQEE